jgi:CheY-like chemotaxis protein
MRILIVEDDYLQANWIHRTIQQALPGSRIDRISTELGFRSNLSDIASNPPNVIILDVMLRWTDPQPEMIPPPDDVREGQFFSAGFRCQRLLAKDHRTKNIPVILYTVLERLDLHNELRDLPDNVYYLAKDPEPDSLISLILKATLQQE